MVTSNFLAVGTEKMVLGYNFYLPILYICISFVNFNTRLTFICICLQRKETQ